MKASRDPRLLSECCDGQELNAVCQQSCIERSVFVFVLNGNVCTRKLPERLSHVSLSGAEIRQMDDG